MSAAAVSDDARRARLAWQELLATNEATSDSIAERQTGCPHGDGLLKSLLWNQGLWIAEYHEFGRTNVAHGKTRALKVWEQSTELSVKTLRDAFNTRADLNLNGPPTTTTAPPTTSVTQGASVARRTDVTGASPSSKASRKGGSSHGDEEDVANDSDDARERALYSTPLTSIRERPMPRGSENLLPHTYALLREARKPKVRDVQEQPKGYQKSNKRDEENGRE